MALPWLALPTPCWPGELYRRSLGLKAGPARPPISAKARFDQIDMPSSEGIFLATTLGTWTQMETVWVGGYGPRDHDKLVLTQAYVHRPRHQHD